MTTVLEQIQEEQQDITIDELMPLWSQYFDLIAAFSSNDILDEFEELHKLWMGNPARCAVGEAHQFTEFYDTHHDIHIIGEKKCQTCTRYSYKSFPDLGYDIRNGKMMKWREHKTVKNFLKHWNRIHHMKDGQRS